MLLHAFIILDRCFLSRDWSRTSGTRVRTLSEPCWEHGTGSGPSSSVPSRNHSSPLSVIPARNLSADERLTHFIGIFPHTWQYGGIFWPSYARLPTLCSRWKFTVPVPVGPSSSRVPTRSHFRTRDQSLIMKGEQFKYTHLHQTIISSISPMWGVGNHIPQNINMSGILTK